MLSNSIAIILFFFSESDNMRLKVAYNRKTLYNVLRTLYIPFYLPTLWTARYELAIDIFTIISCWAQSVWQQRNAHKTHPNQLNICNIVHIHNKSWFVRNLWISRNKLSVMIDTSRVVIAYLHRFLFVLLCTRHISPLHHICPSLIIRLMLVCREFAFGSWMWSPNRATAE